MSVIVTGLGLGYLYPKSKLSTAIMWLFALQLGLQIYLPQEK